MEAISKFDGRQNKIAHYEVYNNSYRCCVWSRMLLTLSSTVLRERRLAPLSEWIKVLISTSWTSIERFRVSMIDDDALAHVDGPLLLLLSSVDECRHVDDVDNVVGLLLLHCSDICRQKIILTPELYLFTNNPPFCKNSVCGPPRKHYFVCKFVVQ